MKRKENFKKERNVLLDSSLFSNLFQSKADLLKKGENPYLFYPFPSCTTIKSFGYLSCY